MCPEQTVTYVSERTRVGAAPHSTHRLKTANFLALPLRWAACGCAAIRTLIEGEVVGYGGHIHRVGTEQLES